MGLDDGGDWRLSVLDGDLGWRGRRLCNCGGLSWSGDGTVGVCFARVFWLRFTPSLLSLPLLDHHFRHIAYGGFPPALVLR